MKRYSYDRRLILMAGILSPLTLILFPKGPFHLMLGSLAAGLFVWGVVLMCLRRMGRSNWNGPSWGRKLHTSPALKPVLVIVPALCAAWVPILFLLNRRWGLSDAQLGMACGVPLGISFAVLVMIRSKGRSCCLAVEAAQTQQGGTK